MTRIVRNMASLGILQIANYVIPLLILPIISRVLGATLFGSVSYAQNIVTYLTLLVNFGFEYSATRQIALAGEDIQKKTRIFWAILTVKSLLLLLSFIILGLLPFCLERIASDPRLYLYTALINVGIVLFPTWYLQGEQQMDKMALANFFIKLMGALLVILLVREASAYRGYPLLLSLASFAGGLGALVYVIRHFHIGKYECSRASLREVLSPSWPIFLNNLFGCLYTTVNMTILGLFAADDVVGYFSASQKLIMALIMIIVLPVSTTIYPEISRRFESSKSEGVKFLKQVMLYAGLAAAVVSILHCSFSYSNRIRRRFYARYRSITLVSAYSVPCYDGHPTHHPRFVWYGITTLGSLDWSDAGYHLYIYESHSYSTNRSSRGMHQLDSSRDIRMHLLWLSIINPRT